MKPYYTYDSALNRVVRHARSSMRDGILYVERGSAGIKVLGAIDYLRNYCKVSVVFFEEAK